MTVEKALAYRQARNAAGELLAVYVSQSEGAIFFRYDEADVEGDDAGLATYSWRTESLARLDRLEEAAGVGIAPTARNGRPTKK